jgi:DNA repair protein RecO (recombination protein O)
MPLAGDAGSRRGDIIEAAATALNCGRPGLHWWAQRPKLPSGGWPGADFGVAPCPSASGGARTTIGPMPLAQDRCICLAKTEYSETSQIVSLLGRQQGLFRVIAKGAHRRTKAGASKFDGGIDLLDCGDAVAIVDVSRDLGTLTEWGLRDGHLELRRTLRGMYLGLYAAELCAALLEEHDPHPRLFDRLEYLLSELPTPRVEEAMLSFELDLLLQTGHAPELASCGECGRRIDARDPVYFSPSRGGVVCRNCEGGTPDRLSVDPRLLRLAQQLVQMPRDNGVPLRLPRLTRHQTDPLNRLLLQHVQHTIGRPLRMTPYVV